ncbi:hypothetical protein GW17_00001369, partial [Ensete ventricosum]
MISWGDIYKVVAAMAPLYVALGLGYGSVRWWRIITPEQCEAINRLVSCITLPLFTFEFTLHIDPFAMNYRFIAADAVSKVIIAVLLAAWPKCSSKGSYCWSVTSFSLSTLTNSLVVGVPLVSAMYGRWAQDLVVQLSVVQAIVWLTLLLFVFELRKAGCGLFSMAAAPSSAGGALASVESPPLKDVDVGVGADVAPRPSFWSLMKTVWLKLALNPNSYASIVGITWAFIANRHRHCFVGLFMALQEKVLACGPSLTAFGMVLKFIAGPAATAIGAIAVGLRGEGNFWDAGFSACACGILCGPGFHELTPNSPGKFLFPPGCVFLCNPC